MSAYEDNDLNAIDQLEDLLEAYREARLAPSGAVLARIRANVLAEAAAFSATNAAANRLRLVETRPAPARWLFPPRFARAVFGLGFAAALTIGTSAAVLAAPPGSAFYSARIYLETLVLPTQLDARLVAHEELLSERLTDVQNAAAQHDTIGLAAALNAYQAEVTAATLDAGNDLDRLAHLEEVLAQHTATLTALAATLSDQSAIDHAILMSSKAIEKLEARTHPAHPVHPPQAGGTSGDGAGASSGGGNTSGSGGGGMGGGAGASGPPSVPTHAPASSAVPGQGDQGGDNQQ